MLRVSAKIATLFWLGKRLWKRKDFTHFKRGRFAREYATMGPLQETCGQSLMRRIERDWMNTINIAHIFRGCGIFINIFGIIVMPEGIKWLQNAYSRKVRGILDTINWIKQWEIKCKVLVEWMKGVFKDIVDT